MPSDDTTSADGEQPSKSVAGEYLALADLLETAGDSVWDAPSLCEGWRTREVIAHVTMPARYDGPAFMAELDAAGGDFTALSNTVAERDGALPSRSFSMTCAPTSCTGGSHRAAASRAPSPAASFTPSTSSRPSRSIDACPTTGSCRCSHSWPTPPCPTSSAPTSPGSNCALTTSIGPTGPAPPSWGRRRRWRWSPAGACCRRVVSTATRPAVSPAAEGPRRRAHSRQCLLQRAWPGQDCR
jgi:hypothetical protein